MASQTKNLREEVTAVLNVASVDRQDRVIVKLNSGGGTVQGYGLAAAQLARFKVLLTCCLVGFLNCFLY